MSSNINIICLIGSMMLIMLPVTVYGQEQNRLDVLHTDIDRLGKRAVHDRIISEEERQDMMVFVRDSLPEDTELKTHALEQIRDDLDEKYAEMIRNSMKLFD